MRQDNKSNLSFYLIGILAITIISLSVFTIKLKKERNYYSLIYEAGNDISMRESIEYIKNLYKNERTFLNTPQKIFSFENHTCLNLADLVKDGPKLILRTRETDCGACLDSTLAILRNNLKAIPHDNIVLLTNHDVPREFAVYLRTNQLRISSYKTEKDIVNLKGDKLTPYFFILEEDLHITMFHQVNRKFPQLTQYYLESIGEKLESN